jgi:hypothetical protein
MTRPLPPRTQQPPRPAPGAHAPGAPPARPSQTPATGDHVPPEGAEGPALANTDELDAATAAAAGAPPSRLTPTQQATGNDDWPKETSWDVTDASGTPVTTLDALAEVLGVDRATAAGALLDSPLGTAAPPELQAEAAEEVNPSGGNLYGEFDDVLPQQQAVGFDQDDDADDADEEEEEEEPVDAAEESEDEEEEEGEEEGGGNPFAKKGLPRAGSLVAWGGGKLRGRVELMVTNGGTVPGVTAGLVGTKTHPVARVRLYRQQGKSWAPTDVRAAVDARALTPLTPGQLTRPASKDPSAQLVLKVARHAGPAGSGKPTAEAIRTVYQRGLDSWPGEQATVLTAKKWALGRVDAFVAKAEGYDPDGDWAEHYVGDDDLLP